MILFRILSNGDTVDVACVCPVTPLLVRDSRLIQRGERCSEVEASDILKSREVEEPICNRMVINTLSKCPMVVMVVVVVVGKGGCGGVKTRLKKKSFPCL